VDVQALNPSTITLLVLAPLLAWRIYVRVRRLVGRQRLSRVRPWITLIILPMIVLLLAFAAYGHLERLLWLSGGVLVGSLLGVYGLRHTRFESTPEGLFYTPHAHLGIALSLLFLGRILYRLVQRYAVDTSAPLAGPDFARSSLTLAIFGLLAGYYVAYAVGLVRWRHSVALAETAQAPGTQMPELLPNPDTPRAGSQTPPTVRSPSKR
jgi:cytochrome b561